MCQQETVSKTAPGLWAEGARLNLERALRVGDEIGGHIVTGHVDAVATVTRQRKWAAASTSPSKRRAALGSGIAPKGSIALDGVSLTVNEVEDAGDTTRFTDQPHPPHRAITPPWAALRRGGSSTSRSTCWRAT